MLPTNNAALPSVPSKHVLSGQYCISSGSESGEKAPHGTSNNRYAALTNGGGERNFSNGVFGNGEMMEGISAVCWNELLMQHCRAISILNSSLLLVLLSSPSSEY